MVSVAPLIIVLGAAGAAGLLVYGVWERLAGVMSKLTSHFRLDIERADLRFTSETLTYAIVGFSVSAWLLFVALAHPNPGLAAAALPIIGFVFVKLGESWLRGKVQQRLKRFNNQLEMILRMIGNGLRVGLGLRQALVLVTEEMPDPARVEFARLIGQTNIGVPLNDALDGLVRRMYSDEARMMVDAIKVQSQSGGNLAKILDHLAATIKGRRNVQRKIRTLTSEARSGAYVIGALPVLVGVYLMIFQPNMRNAFINTEIGHIGLGAVVLLEGLGILSLRQLLAFKI